MRPLKNLQVPLDFQPSGLKITEEHFARYEAISRILDANPKMLELVHRDFERARKEAEARAQAAQSRRSPKKNTPSRGFEYETDTVFRMLLVQTLEGWSLRETVVRIDDSGKLRRFTRLNLRSMLDYSTLCDLKNAIRSKTWRQINRVLGEYAVKEGRIEGEKLRLDTTLVETNIHYPTDSSLLWDSYRKMDSWLRRVRRIDLAAVGESRLQPRRVKRLHVRIQRGSRKGSEEQRELYAKLISAVEDLLTWVDPVRKKVEARVASGSYSGGTLYQANALLREWERYGPVIARIVDQAQRRVLAGENVPNAEKVFSLYEDHTELVKRGKAGKEVEFGHMVQIQQVEEKFITEYDVFRRRPDEPELIEVALARHRELFGELPGCVAADRGYYRGMPEIRELEAKIDLVSIGKKGNRNADEAARESSAAFRLAQAFRAGVEGTISYLKRSLRLARCFNKGWEHYQATVGITIVSHNLLILSRR